LILNLNKKLSFHYGGPTVLPISEGQRPTSGCGKRFPRVST